MGTSLGSFHRKGGLDVPVLDGGTGASTASAGLAALGHATQNHAGIPGVGGGKVLQQVRVQAQTTIILSAYPAVPWDDTRPQIGEGALVMSVAIQPISAASFLVFQWSASIGGPPGGPIAAWIAQTGVSDALAAAFSLYNSGTGAHDFCMSLNHWVASGGTANRTYQIRVGSHFASTLRVGGGSDGAAKYGGSNNNSLIITEYAP